MGSWIIGPYYTAFREYKKNAGEPIKIAPDFKIELE
jgi:hypothetical protein